jgi:hypothetical protein
MPRFTRSTSLLLLPAMLLCRSVAAQDLPTDAELLEPEDAGPRQYTVELIVFEYAENVAVGTEVFPPEVVEIVEEPNFDPLADPSLPLEGPIPDDSVPSPRVSDDEQDAALVDAAAAETEDAFRFILLTEDELTMTGTLDRLDRLDAYQPLLHVGWTQTTLPEEETPALEIADLVDPPEGLDGAFTLYLGRYLHLVVDLELDAQRGERNPIAITDAPSYGDTVREFGEAYDPLAPRIETRVLPLRYAIDENRIMKNGEIRYYDHPKFGVIARVDRVEEEEPEQEPGALPTRVAPAIGGQ